MGERGFKQHPLKRLPGVNLYLVGFMATGKSTVGRALAHRLGYEFLDSDHVIEKKHNCSVREIFETEGEAGFRRYEREFVENGHPAERCVVACGGGMVTQPGILDLLRRKGVVICLYATPETILRRTQGNRNRPLLNVADPKKAITDLMEAREPFYRAAGTLVLTDNRSLGDVTSHLCRIYLREAAAFTKKQRDSQSRIK